MRAQIPRRPGIRVLEGDPSATAGLRCDALEQVRADTNMRSLTEEEFLRGKERLRRTVQRAEHTARTETRTNWLDLRVLR
jgi:hypothetical protein